MGWNGTPHYRRAGVDFLVQEIPRKRSREFLSSIPKQALEAGASSGSLPRDQPIPMAVQAFYQPVLRLCPLAQRALVSRFASSQNRRLEASWGHITVACSNKQLIIITWLVPWAIVLTAVTVVTASLLGMASRFVVRPAYAHPCELASHALRHRKFLDKSAGEFWVIRHWSGFSVLLHDQLLRSAYNRCWPNARRSRHPGHNKSYSLCP